MSGEAGAPVGRPMRCDDIAVGEQLTCVLEQQDAIAQQAPALLGVRRHRSRALTRGVVRCGTSRSMTAEVFAYQVHPSSVHRSETDTWYSDILQGIVLRSLFGSRGEARHSSCSQSRIRSAWL